MDGSNTGTFGVGSGHLLTSFWLFLERIILIRLEDILGPRSALGSAFPAP